MGNVGDSKKTDNTRLNDPTDPLEHIIEIMDNTFPNSICPTGVVDDAGKPVYPISTNEWVPGNTAYDTLYADPFDESMTYGWRYCYDDEDPEVTEPCMEAWRNFYTFVVTSSDEEFKANLKDYFVVDSALFYYLFTHFFTMIDNRAKNSFWHYGKCEDGIYRYDLCFGYDFDSGLGINNSGELTMSYGYEDIDYKTKGDVSTGYAYNGALSVFFCRLRDLFSDELNAMYVNRESAGCWNKTSLSTLFNNSQNEFPEALWMADDRRKYQRTFEEGAPRYYTTMMSGLKKWQREGFLDGQEHYMASKYFGNTAVSDQIMFRCNTPTDENLVVKPDYTLHLTPYADMYLDVLFGATYRTQVRAEAGKQYDIECPFTTMDDTAVLVYCSSQIQSMGDISACYIHDNDFSKASKLNELIIGNATEGYQNSFLTNLGIGNNTLLEKLDIQNTPNLAQALNLAACNNLKELYAYGSGLTGITFANGGKIQIAELPAISSMTMRNLVYLTNLDIVSLDKLTTLTVEECDVIDIKSIIEQAENLNRVRITGIEWTLEDTTLLEKIYDMYGIDKNGYNITQSVLAGKVHVPVIRQQQLLDYQNAWSDLEITFDTVITQYPVTFKNADGTILEVQYVDKGTDAVDPATREENPIIPTLESTISHDFTFASWDSSLTSVFSDRVITATYTESLRSYTIKYVSKGVTLQTTTGLYGECIEYTGDTPIYTGEESGYVYYLFKRWDKSGTIDGDKTVTAIFDKCEYNEGYFDGKELQDLTPVEIYALTKVGIAEEVITDKDPYNVQIGHDYDYDDVESKTFITEKMEFDGTNCLDTGISLFDEDRDFVLAVDYTIKSGNSNNATICQCYNFNGSNGFRIWYNSTPKITWGTESISTASVGTRNLVVIQHKKGDTNLTVYTSNSLDSLTPTVNTIEITKEALGGNTLVFGCARADDGVYENYCIGSVYWAKLWYANLGDITCNNLALWPHQTMPMEACGFKKYYLSDNSNQRCSFTLLASYLLDQTKRMNSTVTNSGGWKASDLCEWLNSRLYKAFPTQIQALLKQVKIPSTVGDKSSEIDYANSYVAIPSYVELNSTTDGVLFYEGSTISWMTSNELRRRACLSNPSEFKTYWYRSPILTNTASFLSFWVGYNSTYGNYVYSSNGSTASNNGTVGVLIMISF